MQTRIAFAANGGGQKLAGQKRKAANESSLNDDQRFTKRFNLLSIGTHTHRSVTELRDTMLMIRQPTQQATATATSTFPSTTPPPPKPMALSILLLAWTRRATTSEATSECR